MNSVVLANLEWHIEQMSLFVVEAKRQNTKNRSRYYKACFLFGAAVCEALLYYIVKAYYETGGEIVQRKRDAYNHVETHKLPKQFQTAGDAEELVVCKRIECKFTWNKNISFQRLIEIARKASLADKSLLGKVNRIRDRRNNIHLQGLMQKDHRYTKRDVEYASTVIKELVDLVSD